MRVLVPLAGVPGAWRRHVLLVAAASSLALVATVIPAPAPTAAADTPAPAEQAEDPAPPTEGETGAPDAVSAMTIARLENRPVEILGERTSTSSTFALPDGTTAAAIASGPVWVRQGGDGSQEADWARIDLTLEAGDGGLLRPASHPADLVLSGGDPDGSSTEPALVGSITDVSSGAVSELTWPGPLPAPRIDGARAVYEDVQPGVDMVVDATVSGFEQFFVVDQAPAAGEELVLPVVVSSDADVAVGADGEITTSASGEVVARSPEPTMWDADSDGDRVHPVTQPWEDLPERDLLTDAPFDSWVAEGAAAREVEAPAPATSSSTDLPNLDTEARAEGEGAPLSADQVVVERTVTELDGGAVQVDLAPQPEFLTDPDTAYPVVVDPSLTLSAGFDTYVDSSYNVDRSGDPELMVGTYNGGSTVARSFINFDVAGLRGKDVINATLGLYEHWSWSCNAREFKIWDTAATSAGTRWGNQPATAALVATSSETKGYSAGCPGGDTLIGLTGLARQWAASGPTTVGVRITATDESDNYAWKKFLSSENPGYGPVVYVNYNRTPNVPTSFTISPSGQVHDGVRYLPTATPTVGATFSDADGGKVTAIFQLRSSGGTVLKEKRYTNVNSGSAVTWKIDSGLMTTGKQYTVRVAASDGRKDSAFKSFAYPLALDLTKPGAPVVTSTDFPADGTWHGEEGQVGTFVLTPAADSSLVKYQWALDKAPDPAKTITASATGGRTSLKVTPPTNGLHTLQVQAVDRAGNLSGVVKYTFNVGRGGIVTPVENTQVVRRVRIKVTGEDVFTHVRFESRRDRETPSTAYQQLDGGVMTDADGQPWDATWERLPGEGEYVTWDAGAMLGTEGGPIQVRAVVAESASGAGAYTTPWVTVIVDQDAGGAATTDIGPASVNLLTGDSTLNVTDVEEFGLSVVRTASSRDTDAGYQLQQERLTTAQQQGTAVTDIAAVNAVVTSSTYRWRTGGSSLRVVPADTGSSANSYASIGGNSGDLRLGMLPGHSYRVTGWIYVPGVTGLTPTDDRGQRLVVYTRSGTDPYPNPVTTGTASARPTITDAWQELSVDVTIPDDATEAFFRIYNGLPAGTNQNGGNVPVYFDDLSVKEIWSPFGPEWELGTTDTASGTAYTKVVLQADSRIAAVHTVGGGKVWFTTGDGSTWFPQPGAENLQLRRTSSTTWRVTDVDGTITDFVQGKSSKEFPVSVTSAPAATGKARHIYDVVDGQYRLTRIIAPIETGVDGWPGNSEACTTETPAVGCEVLQFRYATLDSDARAAVKGRVSRISAWVYDAGAMTLVDVARFQYDENQRLQKVWDPRIGTSTTNGPGAGTLVTSYTYDDDGRLTGIATAGELPWSFTYGTGGQASTNNGDWIDPGKGRLLSVERESLVEGSVDQVGPTNSTTFVYGVPLTRAAGGPYDMDTDTVASWAQYDRPTDATAVFGPQDPPAVTTATASVPGADGYRSASVHYLNAAGWEVNLAGPAGATTPPEGAIVTSEYDEHGNTIRTLDATNRLLALHAAPGWEEMLVASGLDDAESPQLAQQLDARSYYSTDGLDLLVSRGPAQRLAVGDDADDVQILHPVTRTTYDEGKPDGLTYHLPTTVVSGGMALGEDPAEASLVDVITTTNRYTPIDSSSPLGPTSGWLHKNPTQVKVSDGAGTALTSSVVYDDQGRPIRSYRPGSSGGQAGTVMTLFYTAGTNSGDAACSNKPQWAGQPCVTKASGSVTGHDTAVAATDLPVKRVTGYNRWGSPTVVTDSATGPVAGASAAVTRTTTTTYDSADRVVSVAIAGTGTGVGAAVATTRTVYDAATGEVAEVQSVGASGQTTASVSKQFDLLGRLVSYTDSTGATTRSTYDRWGNLVRTSQDVAGTTATVDYTYDRSLEPRGYITSMTDSVAGEISATWGFDGQLETQHLPGGVTLAITYDAARVPVARVYTRDSDGEEIWRDSVVENHRGQWIGHESTTGVATYGYDRVGRLTKATDAPAGADAVCTSRAYGYDLHSNRTSWREVVASTTADGCLSTDDPTATETGYTYDSADRLMSTTADPGTRAWVYDPFGRTTSMPTADGGTVTNTYTVNDLVASQEIAGESRYSWSLDPLHRRTTNVQQVWMDDAWQESATVVSHYADDSDSPSWITEDVTNPTDVTRYVNDVQGAVTLTTSTTGDRQLQLVDLHGDIVGTLPVADGAAEATWSGLVYGRTDEFGAPAPLTGAGATTGPPNRYGWLGAEQRSSEALGGVVLMGVRLYSTATGRFLSIDSIAGGSASAYDYCNADPVNCTDLAGTFSLRSVLSAVAVVGEVASLIPGPVGAAAAGISAAAYAVQGNTAKAIEMGITVAAALVGAGAAVKVAARAVSTARAAGQVAARAAPKIAAVAEAAKPVERGVYVVFAHEQGKMYVGMSKNISRRLEQHVASGKVTREAARAASREPVTGPGTISLRIAEQATINRLGGIDNLANMRNEIARRKWHIYGIV